MGKSQKRKTKLTVKELYDRKVINDPREPVWVYLDREMRAIENKKPYNKKVGAWLEFMKDLYDYYRRRDNNAYRRVKREAGPVWFLQFSSLQKEVLLGLRENIAQDLIEGLPIRVSRALRRLGITVKFPTNMLLETMTRSIHDPGLFMWFLYEAYYGVSPTELLPHYDVNAMMMMSSLVCIDMEECVQRLEELTVRQPAKPPKPKKNPRMYFQPHVKYGEYLQKHRVPALSDPPMHRTKPKKPLPLAYKLKIRSAESYEALTKKTSFIQKRVQRNLEAKIEERVCKYKFWEPPTNLRNTDPKMAAIIQALRMSKMRARPRYLKHKPPYENVQCHIGNVSYSSGYPTLMLNNYCLMPTGYVLHNGGITKVNNEYITNILGSYKFPRNTEDKCDSECGCVTNWENSVMKFLDESKCKCGHLYDFYHEGKAKEKVFRPATRLGPFSIDKAKLYQMDPTPDFIRRTVREAVESKDPTVSGSEATISLTGMKLRELLAAFLADLSDSPLIIPHLPQAELIQSLQGWVNRRIRGKYIPLKKRKQLNLNTQKRWRDLGHMDFRARAYRIPFTAKELDELDFSDITMLKKLNAKLFDSFITRNRLKMIQQTRLWWSTMKDNYFPSQSFLDAFFAYMPVRMTEIFLINPHGTGNNIRDVGHTCPLNAAII